MNLRNAAIAMNIPADNVMCWIFSVTWSATEFDVVEFSNSLVRRPHREPPLYFYKLSQE